MRIIAGKKPHQGEDEDDTMDEELVLLKRLEHLRDRHRELDEQIKGLSDAANLNQLMIARLKKEKLTLRDEIARIERIVYPDLIA